MKKIKNLTELELYRQKLKYKEKLLEKEIVGNTSVLIEHFSDLLKDYAFDLGTRLIWLFFKNKKHEKNKDSK